MRELQQDENALQERLDALQKERGRHRKALQEMRAGLAKDLRSAYLMGRQEQIKLMLNQEDPATFSRVLAYHGYFTRSRSERIQAMRDTLDAVAATGAEITAQGTPIRLAMWRSICVPRISSGCSSWARASTSR